MRRVRYGVGMSLDAFIADPKDGAGFLVQDPTYDFRPFFATVDAALLGRRTFEVMLRGGYRSWPGLRTYVFSRTLSARDFPEVTLVAEDAAAAVAALRAADGKDIWLGGGGVLFRSLAEADLVDTVEVGISPVLIGQGVPLAPSLPRWLHLDLTEHRVYPTGLVTLSYAVRRAGARTSA
jgi:dihydrofolate reductase